MFKFENKTQRRPDNFIGLC